MYNHPSRKWICNIYIYFKRYIYIYIFLHAHTHIPYTNMNMSLEAGPYPLKGTKNTSLRRLLSPQQVTLPAEGPPTRCFNNGGGQRRRLPLKNQWLARCWQLTYFLFSPRKLGKISNLTSIFFRWVEATNQLGYGWEDDVFLFSHLVFFVFFVCWGLDCWGVFTCC